MFDSLFRGPILAVLHFPVFWWSRIYFSVGGTYTHLSLKVDPGQPPNPIYFEGGSTLKEAAQNPFLALKWSDYGLFENRQDRKMQFFMANRFPLLPRPCETKKGPFRPKFKIRPPIYFLGGSIFREIYF